MSFFDHFPGSSLDARWTSVLAANGTMTVSDSILTLDSPVNTDASFVYYGTQLDQNTSQLWLVAVSVENFTNVAPPFRIQNNATAPVAETAANNGGRRILEIAPQASPVLGWQCRYWDTGGTLHYWDDAGAAWSTTASVAITPTVVDDYYVVGVEFDADGGHSRFRMCGVHQTVASGYSVDQGLRIFALTDWVDWSGVRSQADGLWLILGDMLTGNNFDATRIEWVRHADGEREFAYTNTKDAVSGDYALRTSWGYDQKFYLPKDRTTTEVGGINAKDPCCVFDGSTYHLFYRDDTVSPNRISRATSSTPDGTFTYQDSPVTAAASHALSFPAVMYIPWEVSGREWQLLYGDWPGAGTSQEICLATAAAASGSWTNQGVVIPIGSGSDADATWATGPVPLRRNGEYEVWYTGLSTVGGVTTVQQSGMRATGPALDALTKDGAGARLTTQDQVQLITSNLDGSVASMADTTGFVADMPVYFNQDNNDDNWTGSKIRKVTANTSLELVHRVMGFTTAAGAKAFGALAGNQQIRNIVYDDTTGAWLVYLTTFNHAKRDATFTSFQEECSLLIVPNGTDLTDMAPSMYSWIDSPVVYRGSWGNIRSNENLALISEAWDVEPAIGGLTVNISEPVLGERSLSNA